MHKVLYLSILACLVFNMKASDITDVSPITNRILMLRFDDGYIRHYGYQEPTTACITYNYPLNVSAATNPLNYALTSSDDMDFSSPVKPTEVGRKSKGHDFSRNCKWTGTMCDNDYISEHFIFLFLPAGLKEGKTYQLQMTDLAENRNTISFTFNTKELRSDAIRVNQVGYLPDAGLKFAYISYWMGDKGGLDLDEFSGTKFHLIDFNSKQAVFEGTIQKRLDIASSTQKDLPNEPRSPYFSMTDVWECDFSSFSTPGDYVISVDNIGCSYPFRIGKDIYREAYYHTIRSLYHNRTGIALEPQYTDWHRPRTLHPDDGKVKFQYSGSKMMNISSENGDKASVYDNVNQNHKITTWGWYMDAGDWDGYYSHTSVPRNLMTAFELAPHNFSDGELNIPESGNGIPDILDEARWLINYLDRTRGPSGGIAGTRVHPDFETHPADGVPSWEDTRVWTIYGEDPKNTFTFAGLCAQLAYCYQLAGIDGSQALITKAEDAYDWAITNTSPGDPLANSKLYAAAWLYKVTGAAIFQNQFIQEYSAPQSGSYSNENRNFANYAFATVKHAGVNLSQKNTCIAAIRSMADGDVVDPAGKRSFRVGFNWTYPVLVGQATTPMVLPALVMYYISGEDKYRNAALTSCDYYLGGNPLNILWMTGYGHHRVEQVLHLDTWYRSDRKQEMIPGIIPYGPTLNDWLPNNGPWASEFAMDRVYPEKTRWPAHETFFDNRYAVASNEYTVHQNMAPAASIYGVLCDTAKGFTPNLPPQIEFPRIVKKAGQQVYQMPLIVNDPDGSIYKVEYYYDWHKLGESTKEPYEFHWENAPNPKLINAIAYDNQGARARAFFDDSNSIPRHDEPDNPVQLFPNPGNREVNMVFSLDKTSSTTLNIYDVKGHCVATQCFGTLEAGPHHLITPVDTLPKGVYIFKLVADFKQGTRTFSSSMVKN